VRVLVLAPFERGRDQGGSLRSTAIAERLEERGAEVDWRVVRRRELSRTAKLRAAQRGRPVLAELYEPPAVPPAAPDAILVAHSYLLDAVRHLTGGVPTIVDFHNLEWRHLLDGAGGRIGPLRRAWVRRQARLMRRFEVSAVATSQLSLFVSEEELRWATGAAPQAPVLHVPSVMPRATERAGAEIARARSPEPGELAYVGTLTFPPNVASLERFLAQDWPVMRATVPGLRLTVAGACSAEVRARLGRHPTVNVLGFVEDLTPLLARCQAVAMPFDGAAGTSLRAVFYALAGLPVVGSAAAFRGIGFPAGVVAEHPAEWAAAVGGNGPARAEGIAAAARREAARLQGDPEPWDALFAALEAMTPTSRRPVGVSA
jgi:glycosyltransferase involved in cell wall biosynthesis